MTKPDAGGYHVGIILDGNGRWATSRKQPRLFGHNAGFRNVNPIVKACPECGVSTISLYAFAIANWKRDKEEVDGLWNIFRRFFTVEMNDLIAFGARLRMLGDKAGIPSDVLELIEEAEQKSKDNTKLTVQIALNYDGVDEVARATRKIAEKITTGELSTADINPTLIEANLDTGGIKPVDIVIRTGLPQVDTESGMAIYRSSSFLQLQSAQAVCVSTPVLWPDFSERDLKAAITLAKPDERLFGGQRQEIKNK